MVVERLRNSGAGFLSEASRWTLLLGCYMHCRAPIFSKQNRLRKNNYSGNCSRWPLWYSWKIGRTQNYHKGSETVNSNYKDFFASYQLSLLYTSKIFIFIIAGAIFRWDLSVIDDFPDDIKISLQFFFNTANELAVEVVKTQGRDMTAILKDCVCVYRKIRDF